LPWRRSLASGESGINIADFQRGETQNIEKKDSR
jgi:hypothetical protein